MASQTQSFWPPAESTCVCQKYPQMPFQQLPCPPPFDALTFPNVLPANDNVMPEKLSVVELNVNDPDSVPVAPMRGPEKLSVDPAEAQIDTASTNTEQTAASL